MKLEVKHLGSFLVLFLLSTLRADALFPQLPISFAPLTLVVLVIIVVWKVHITVGVSAFIKKHWKILSLVLLYQTACVISLWINRHGYPSNAEFIKWGVTFVVVQAALPLAVILFFLPNTGYKLSLSNHKISENILLGTFLFIFGVAIWQVSDSYSAQHLSHYFLAGELKATLMSEGISNTEVARIVGHNINSVFAIRTDFGAIAATAFLAFTTILVLPVPFSAKVKFGVLVSLCLFTGFISGARIFLLMIIAGIIVLFIYVVRHLDLRKSTVLCLFIASLTFLLSFLMPADAVGKLYGALPFLTKFNLGIPLSAVDLLPGFDRQILSSRDILWERAIDNFYDNPILGTSNGLFRLANSAQEKDFYFHNAHNVIIQSLVDAGIIGLTLLTMIWSWIFLTLRRFPLTLLVFMAVTAGLMVDNFTDHSLPWIICCTYLLSLIFFNEKSAKKTSQSQKSQSVHLRLPTRNLLLATLVISLIGIFIYQKRQADFSSSPIDAQILTVSAFLTPDIFEKEPVVISEEIEKELSKSRFEGVVKYLHSVSSFCDFAYPNGGFFHFESELQIENSIPINVSNDTLMFTPSPVECQLSLKDPLSFKHWTSNNYYYMDTYNGDIDSSNALLIKYDHIRLYSPVFNGNVHESMKLRLHAIPANGAYPKLKIEYYDAQSGALIKEEILNTEQNVSHLQLHTPPIERVFIKMYISDFTSNEERQDYLGLKLSRV